MNNLFKIGDNVLIAKSGHGTNRAGWGNHIPIERTVGYVGVIKQIHTRNGYLVQLPRHVTNFIGADSPYWYNEELLELSDVIEEDEIEEHEGDEFEEEHEWYLGSVSETVFKLKGYSGKYLLLIDKNGNEATTEYLRVTAAPEECESFDYKLGED